MHCDSTSERGLSLLKERVYKDLAYLDFPKKNWITPSEEGVYNVCIIGGGQSGLAAYFALWCEGVHHCTIIDENPVGEEGPWRTFARMDSLRTPKHLTGPDYGVPSLTPRAWFTAKFGEEAWEKCEFISTANWADYLTWFRECLNIPVQNGLEAGSIEWVAEKKYFSIPISKKGAASSNNGECIKARKIIIANGIDGSGSWHVPEFITKSLPKKLYYHTRETIPFDQFKGKSIGILGAGASAFDNSIFACENGASAVDLFFRRPSLVKINPYRWAEFPGFLYHHSESSDEMKWKFISKIVEIGQLPPKNTYAKATSYKGVSLHAGSSWTKVEEHENKVRVQTEKGEQFIFDFLIIATGFKTELKLRKELKNFVEKIALWEDHFHHHANLVNCAENVDLKRHPYLNKGLQFMERVAGTAPFLNSIFNYNFGCLLSNGFGGASLSGLKYSMKRMVAEITKQFFQEDINYYYDSLCNYNKREIED